MLQQDQLNYAKKEYVQEEIMKIKVGLQDMLKEAEQEMFVGKTKYTSDQNWLRMEIQKHQDFIADLQKYSSRHEQTIDAHDTRLRTCLTDKDWQAFDDRIGTLPTKEAFQAYVELNRNNFEGY